MKRARPHIPIVDITPYGAARRARWQQSLVAVTLIALGLLGLALLLTGCANWRSTAKKSLAIAQDVSVSVHIAANAACKPAVASCIAAKLNPCPALVACQAKRRPVYRALLDAQALLSVAYRAVDASDKPSALQLVALAIDAAKAVCDALKAWGSPVAACAAVGQPVEVTR